MRLTKRVADGVVPSTFPIDFIFDFDDEENKGFNDTMERLAAYEDTGLMPEEIKAQPRWISVTDRLPEYGQYVLLVAHGWNTEYGDIYIGRLKTVKADDGSGNFWGIVRPECEWSIAGWSYFRIPIVTHWMPLPEPPKEASE